MSMTNEELERKLEQFIQFQMGVNQEVMDAIEEITQHMTGSQESDVTTRCLAVHLDRINEMMFRQRHLT